MAKKALLMILDGWGIGQHGKGDVIYNTPTPYLDYLTAVSAHSSLHTNSSTHGARLRQRTRALTESRHSIQ